MKKIKIMHGFVIGLIVVFALSFIGNIYLEFFSDFMDPYRELELYNDFIFGYYTSFVGVFLSVFTFIGLIYVENGLRITLKNGMFNDKSSHNFIMAGKLFFVSAILGVAFDIAVFLHSEGQRILGITVESLSKNFLLIILAFVLYIIADIIKNGNELKLDNDLTI
ncbi:hypothetical protein [Aequorivita xiaoshiensis]|uniref:DUF2975 domain-containing protein n=1 Tax=Aequorivita xiaoshiensis TaxID=2874476 RepID=A0A9X1R1M9_9FLAO|nr:hypothetical protein [Aequorivita xiaoshiensis]MCG2429923.1 hypothetical protein [Aequorivita xiaoshiensis]